MNKTAISQIDLVKREGQLAFTTSLIIASGCDNRSHESTIKLIRKYRAELLQLGRTLDFKSELNTQGGLTEYAILNEDQATFLITLFRNTPVVVNFKLQLIKAFRAALDEISNLYSNPPRTNLLQDKRKSMWSMTDALKEIREEAGKETKGHHYTNENRLCNWALTGKFQSIDETALSNDDMVLLKAIREKNAAFLRAELAYEERKSKLMAFAIRRRTKLLSFEQKQVESS